MTDAAGQPLPEVAVQLLDAATDERYVAKADAAGAFRFSLLPPGMYEVEFAHAGFKAARMEQLTLNASEVSLLDATLEPGDSAEVVECRCHVRAAAPSSGTLVDQKTITAMPLTTRNFTQVLSMSSGTVASATNAATLGRLSPSVNVNGNTSAGGYTVDGAWAPKAVPNPDTISEFKIQTSQYDAMFGAMVPSTNLMTKRGENSFHGSAFEFLRNDLFNANDFFRNATAQPKAHLKQNQFGATAGGPIKQDKLFFFTSYQGTRQISGLDPTSLSNMILPPLTDDRSAAALAAQFCSGNHAGGASRYQTYAGGKQLDCTNQNTATTAGINAVALRLLQMKGSNGQYLIPSPQTIIASGPSAGLGFSTFSLPSFFNENDFLINSDYVVSRRNTLSSRVFAGLADQVRSFGSPGGLSGAPIVPGFGAPQALDGGEVATSLRLTTPVSANLVNEAFATFTRSVSDAKAVGLPDAAPLGITPADRFFPKPPEITILGPLGSFRVFGTAANDFYTENRTYSWADNVSWVHGRQRLRGGGYLLTQYNGRLDPGLARGKMMFQTFDDFLLGLSAADNLSPARRSNVQSVQANEGVGSLGEVVQRYRRYYGAAWVQDDIKVGTRFTVNLGLRWEYIGPSLDESGTIGNMALDVLQRTAIPPLSGTLAGNTVAANYDPNLVNPYTGQPFGPPPSRVPVRASKSFYDNGTPLDKFAPRVGFAWQPWGSGGRLVVGGAYGWFYQAPPYGGNAASAGEFTSPPFAQGFTNADSSNNFSTFAQPFPTTTLGYVPRTPTSQLSDRVAGPEYRIPRLQQWNLTTKIRLAGTVSLDLGYVGSHGGQLLLARGFNQPLLASAAQPVNCGYDGVASDCVVTNTAANAAQRVPVLGETPTALATSEFTGASWYHSMQATVRKQMSKGLMFQVAYTLSKSESNLTVLNDQNDLSFSNARTSFDRTHRLIANFDYQLPLLSGATHLERALLGGWSLTGIVLLQSGLPLTLTDPNGGTVFGRAATSTITMCPGATYASLATSGGETSRLNRWIDSSAACTPPILGADGSAGYGNAGQSILNGPGQVNADFSLGRRARVGGLRESAALAFRAEFYNAMNHPQFANPGTTLRTAGFGVITQTAAAPRLIQFGLKYLF